MPSHHKALTLDFFNTLVFHREGRGRGHVLTEYLRAKGFQPTSWEHGVLYDAFGQHDRAYSPTAPLDERREYYVMLARRVFMRLGIDGPAADHADALWEILGPASFGVFPDVGETLRALRREGVRIAVVSNWQSGLRHFCAELGLSPFLDHIVGSSDVGVEKPDPRIFRKVSKLLAVPPERLLHVGDTYADDYVGAVGAGFAAVLIDRDGDRTDGSVRTIRTLTELLDLPIQGAS